MVELPPLLTNNPNNPNSNTEYNNIEYDATDIDKALESLNEPKKEQLCIDLLAGSLNMKDRCILEQRLSYIKPPGENEFVVTIVVFRGKEFAEPFDGSEFWGDLWEHPVIKPLVNIKCCVGRWGQYYLTVLSVMQHHHGSVTDSYNSFKGESLIELTRILQTLSARWNI